MKRKVLCFLLCLSFCFFTLSLSSSAVGDDEVIVYGMTKSDMIEYGYVFDEDGYSFFLPYGVIPPEAYFPSIMLASEPKYPSFNPSKLPWSDAPSAVQEILSMTTDKANTTDMSSYEMPFVAVRINSSNITVFVGINCYLGVADSTYNARVCTSSGAVYANDFKSICYTAVFNTNCTIKTDWRQVESVVWGDTGKVRTYSSATFIGDDYKVDLYVYGGNGARYNFESGSPSSAGYSSTSSTQVWCYMNNRMGFTSSADVLWGSAGGHFPNVYVSLFNPPTIKEMEQETQKGIWASIKELPTKIADSIKGFFTSLGDRISGFFEKLVEDIKGLFVPSEGFFDSYIEEYKTYFSERFGILFEVPDSILNVLQQLIEFNPSEEGYYIDFPEVVMPVLEHGEWHNVVLIEETEVRFDFLNEGPISHLYSLYRSALWLMFVFLLINLIIRKSDKVLGGGTG